jgi:hypothetical protein
MQMQNVDLVTFLGFLKDFLQRKHVSVKERDKFYIHSHTVANKKSQFLYSLAYRPIAE